MAPWLRQVPGGVELELLVQPRASRTRILGPHGDRLRIALAAPPVDGEANAALVELLAGALGVRRSEVEVVRGPSGRRKTVRVSGADATRVEAALAR
jgi:uncharacterized protein (TIGR00251 family)